ncbi:condensation domain-containing protein [Dactylosporangium sp. NPDC050688]|uniref:condensation domain-containing protein n=1 Tax=Dactylosporangium sp. NPDC050688 TaxID=3157217 RepID=UPI0033DBB1D7
MVPLRFEGHRDAAGPLTAGQRNIAKWLLNAPHAPAAVLDHTFAVPPGTTVEDVAACLRVLLCRHEGLRSTYRLGDPGEQRVLAAGSLPLLVHDADGGGDAPDGGGAGAAARLVALCRAEPFDVAAEPPVRFGVAVTAAGLVTAAVMVCSHLAVDFQALAVLDAEFAEMIRDPAARVPGEPRPQPLDRAALEDRPARRRRMDQAVRHWARALRVAPAHPYAKPRTAPPAASGAGTGSGACGMSSPAAAMALEHVAARTGASRPAIVLAAFCALLSRRTGDATCTFVTLSANRFESDLLRYVGTLAQATFLTVEVGDSGFDALVRRCFGAVLQAGLHGAYDVHRQHEQSTRIVAERGIAPTFEPMFNSIVMDTRAPAPGSLRDIALAPATETQWVDLPATDILLRFDLGSVDGALIARVWTGDTSRVSPAEAESLLLALERLVIAAAGGDLDHAGIVGALGLAPIQRPPGWLHIDHCWVDVAEVQRLLDDALAPAVCRVFPGVDGVPLTAYVAGGPATAQEAHERCLAALPGRHAAMAPQRYVLCGQSPADPALLAAWQAEPVLAEGSGRTGDLALSAV